MNEQLGLRFAFMKTHISLILVPDDPIARCLLKGQRSKIFDKGAPPGGGRQLRRSTAGPRYKIQSSSRPGPDMFIHIPFVFHFSRVVCGTLRSLTALEPVSTIAPTIIAPRLLPRR